MRAFVPVKCRILRVGLRKTKNKHANKKIIFYRVNNNLIRSNLCFCYTVDRGRHASINTIYFTIYALKSRHVPPPPSVCLLEMGIFDCPKWLTFSPRLLHTHTHTYTFICICAKRICIQFLWLVQSLLDIESIQNR